MSDYIPDADADFRDWLDQFVTYMEAHLADLKLATTDVTPFTSLRTQYANALTANDTAQAQARAARSTKDRIRSEAEGLVRPMVTRIQGTAGVTDAHREGLGITVRSTTRAPVTAPTTRPTATIDTTHRLQHTINFGDEGTPGSRAKPDGVLGCEIWMKVDGPPPVDPGELRYVATDTRTPYVVDFDGANGGKTAYYMLRWMSTRGEAGPWSLTVSATISA